MAADRVPQPGEVWSFRHRWPDGRVTISTEPPAVPGGVRFVYHGTRTPNDAESVAAFVRSYDFLAVDEQTAVEVYGPQLRRGERSLAASMPHQLGTAVD